MPLEIYCLGTSFGPSDAQQYAVGADNGSADSCKLKIIGPFFACKNQTTFNSPEIYYWHPRHIAGHISSHRSHH